jgi:hypothetical protein
LKLLYTPKINANKNSAGNALSIGNPGGGGGAGGGGVEPSNCAEHTKLINTNKIEAKVFLFCTIIIS